MASRNAGGAIACTMLLIRDKPLPAESLSSFRQRIWRLNGHRLFPVFPPELRRTDPDLQGNDEVLRSVAEMVNMSTEEMRSHTLWPHPLLSYQQLGKGRRIPRWVSLLQYARHGLGTGSHFCPVCLNDGGEIYFRIQWRLSVSLACPLHRVQMQNRCSECALPAWPYAAASFIGYFERDLDIDQCPRCFAQLRNSIALKETSTGVLDCADAVTSGNIRTSAGELHKVPLEQWFCALRSIMNIALRSRSRKKVYADVVVGEVAAMLDRAAVTSTPFDRLEIELRRQLVSVAWPLLENWPSSFLEFSSRCHISAVDFSEDRSTLPQWFVHLINVQLGRPSRSVTRSQVEAVIHDLKTQGLPVNVERVGKIVGSRDAEAVRTRLSKRHVATADETEMLAVGLKLYMSSSLSRRISSKNVRARNVIALIVSILR